MTKITEPTTFDEEHVYYCDCTDLTHVVHVSWDEEPESRFMTIEGSYVPTKLWPRAKLAWRVLRGQPFGQVELILNEDTVVSIRNTMENFLKEDNNDN